jgi:hypothetical protein
VQQNAGDITLVCIGPLTNVAVALCRYPQIASQVRAIALMGGELISIGASITSPGMRMRHKSCSRPVRHFRRTGMLRDASFIADDCANIKRNGSALCQLLGECIDLWWPSRRTNPVR